MRSEKGNSDLSNIPVSEQELVMMDFAHVDRWTIDCLCRVLCQKTVVYIQEKLHSDEGNIIFDMFNTMDS